MQNKLLNNDLKFREFALNKFKNKITFQKKSPLGFDKYIYTNKEAEYVIPFRLKSAKNQNMPLFIYCPGSASNGHKNIFNLIEFFAKMSFTGLFKNDCNIIVPQAIHNTETDEKNIIDFCINLTDLKNEIIKQTAANKKKVYIIGTSQGGFAVWYSLLLFPDDYTAATAVEGAFIGERGFGDDDIKKIAKTPLWVAHSSNDKCVSIDSDDKSVKMLKKTGADVLYTRMNKYGHKMSTVFYKTKPFINWMLEKEKTE